MRMRKSKRGFLIPIVCGLLSGCTGGRVHRSYTIATGGQPNSGQQVIVRYRCGSCHTIPGIRDAHGVFGPPLNSFGRRSMIAGEFPNEPDILVHWVMSPKSLKPRTAMPELGISEQEARDVAAYLYTLQ
jgi:cytochrome c